MPGQAVGRELQNAVMGTSALQMMEEAGTQGADCPLQTQWVRLAAILMQQIM